MRSGKTVEPGGLNRVMGKRTGWCITPAYRGGRVFSLSTVGRLYCYRARDGEKLWETDIGAAHQRWLAELKDQCETGSMPKGEEKSASLVVAGGVLVVPLFDGHVVCYDLRAAP